MNHRIKSRFYIHSLLTHSFQDPSLYLNLLEPRIQGWSFGGFGWFCRLTCCEGSRVLLKEKKTVETRRKHSPATSGAASTAGSDIFADKTSSLKVEKVLNDIILVGVNIGMLFEEDLV